MPTIQQLAVIGAGVAGLAAAQRLAQHGISITIYEKSRGLGGRAAARRVHGCTIDHGAQIVQTPTPQLRELITSEMTDNLDPAQDIGRPTWTFNALGMIEEGDPEANARSRWCWPAGMNTLARTMAAGLDVRRSTHVHHLSPTGAGYTLYDVEGQPLGSADAVLLTPPGPQTAEIIAASHIDPDLRDALLDELSASSYRRCLSIALAYPRRVPVPWYALVNHDHQHPVAWLACEHDKPGHVPADIGVMLAQMGHEFSAAHWDDAEKGTYGEAGAPMPPYMVLTHEYVQALLDTDLGPPLWADLHRWRYALPATGADFGRLNSTGSGLYFAGDYVNRRGRVHEAIERGWQIAAQIVEQSAP
jgi:hypothetical protein